MGASLALGGLAGCDHPLEEAVPYVDQPGNMIPGEPLSYATAMLLFGSARSTAEIERKWKFASRSDPQRDFADSDEFLLEDVERTRIASGLSPTIRP
jgi:hypothetical protein